MVGSSHQEEERIFEAISKAQGFCKALDALRVIPGIWTGLNMGVLDKIIAMKCYEVSNVPKALLGDAPLTFSRKSYTMLYIS